MIAVPASGPGPRTPGVDLYKELERRADL